MSHEYVGGRVSFNCDSDGCHNNIETDEHSFQEAWKCAKEYGWVTFCTYVRSVSKWVHYCPSCKKNLGD